MKNFIRFLREALDDWTADHRVVYADQTEDRSHR